METIDLSSFFKTKAQALDFSIRLASVAQRSFATDFNLESELSEQFGLQKKDGMLALFRNQGISTEKASAIKDFLTQLQTQVQALPVLSLSLAFEPKDATLKVLSDWFLLNIKRQVLFDIAVDPSHIAGIVIHFNGKFLDYSIRDAVNSVIQRELTPPIAQPKAATSPTTTQSQATSTTAQLQL